MARKADTGTADAEVTALGAIAEAVRGTFRTAEGMTQSFIREAIIQGAFPPGQRLNLDVIAESLGVSRMPVRASLRQLESEGLVHISPRRGVTVSVLNAEEIAEIYELRILLETHLLERAMGALDDEFVDHLDSIAHRAEGAGDRPGYRFRLSETLYQRADRPRALALVNSLRASVGRYQLLHRVEHKHSDEQLIGFLRTADVDGAKAWLTEHLSSVSARLQEYVRGDTG